MPRTSSSTIERPKTIAQRATQATIRLQEIVGRDDLKKLSVALIEAAFVEAESNPNFVRSIQSIYDAISTSTKSTTRKPTSSPRKHLTPIVSVEAMGDGFNDKPSAYGLQKMYGNEQLRDALDGYTLATLKEMAEEVVQRNPGTKPQSKSKKGDVVDYIVASLTA